MIDNLIDDSFQKYVELKELNLNFYRVFDNNSYDDRIIINSKIEKIVDIPRHINNIFNIDISCGNIIHIPMANDIFIEYLNMNELINISNLDININNNYLSNSKIKRYSLKENNNIIYQDIIIESNKTFVIIQIYKFKLPLDNITHGAFIIYQNDNMTQNNSNTVFYTKNSHILKLKNITDTNIINHLLNDII